ncbi:hypothetical protein HU751_022790 [Pseudomonas sp. BW13M1]|uniref:Uncharacterized protein n=1 Tax=Pseudomonas peradeniyensis TaxID=2745488 RepID=A0A923G8V9_9PSED|nr:hypothetical protein [Pseudomonas peradeniyensis]MBV4507663.1 hypothetical protein [Pseudomonas peradeniyensis]
MEAWLAGLLGALVGAAGSFGGIWIQSRYQHQREMAKMVMESATKDRDHLLEMARKNGGGGPLPPVVLFVHYHGEMFKLMGKGKLNHKRLKKLHEENSEMWRLIRELDEKRRAAGL